MITIRSSNSVSLGKRNSQLARRYSSSSCKAWCSENHKIFFSFEEFPRDNNLFPKDGFTRAEHEPPSLSTLSDLSCSCGCVCTGAANLRRAADNRRGTWGLTKVRRRMVWERLAPFSSVGSEWLSEVMCCGIGNNIEGIIDELKLMISCSWLLCKLH